MRLVQLADYGGPYAGSFVPMLLALLTTGRERGYEPLAVFTDVCRDRPWLAEFDAEQIPYRFTARGAIGRSVEELAAETPCVLHSHFSAFDLACARAAREHGGVTFWHIHSALKSGFSARVRNSVRFAVLSRGVSAILCVAPQIAAQVRRRLGPRGRVQFEPNAIDLARFLPRSSADRRAERAQLGVPPADLVLLHFGHDWARKGGDVFLRAARTLRDGGRNVVAVTIGGGEPARRSAQALGIDEVVLTPQPTNEVRRLYAAADLLVMPSRAEGMPFALAEALACGLPAVATDAPGEREIAAGLAACRLTAPEPGAVAAASVALLDRSPAQAEDDSRRARESVEQRLALPAWTNRIFDRYERARRGQPSSLVLPR